jgi:hypothetical protein
MNELYKIRDSLKRREDVDTLAADLRWLKAEIDDLLALAGDTDTLLKRQMFEDRARNRRG